MTVAAIRAFADDVGPVDAVVAVGARTAWEVGGGVVAGAREVRAPSGIVSYDPAEMVVRVLAGTPVGELTKALAEARQHVALDPTRGDRATVGGVLAVGRSGLRRPRLGPVRDTVLEVTFVNAEGEVVKAGGPVVKNVTGFDLCRLMVGSLGTLGLIAEVVLRCLPVPPVSRWLQARADPFATIATLHRPASVLWDGEMTWVLLEGHGADVDAQTRLLGPSWETAGGPPPLPPHPHSVDPSLLPDLSGAFVAEVGVGTVHRREPAPIPVMAPAVAALNARVKALFDPAERLAPGRVVV